MSWGSGASMLPAGQTSIPAFSSSLPRKPARSCESHVIAHRSGKNCDGLTQLPLHLIAAPHFVDKLALEAPDIRVELRRGRGRERGRRAGRKKKTGGLKEIGAGIELL